MAKITYLKRRHKRRNISRLTSLAIRATKGTSAPTPTAWWSFDSGTVNFSTGVVTDVSGNGYSATEVNMTSGNQITGKFNQALSFNGSSDYVALPQAAFNYPSWAGSFAVWFRTTATGGTILGQNSSGATVGVSTPSGYVSALYVGTDGKVYASLFWHGNNADAIVSSATYNDGNWHLLVDTYDGTTERLYIDGVLIGSQTFSQLDYNSGSYDYWLGVGYSGGGWVNIPTGWSYFSGDLDEAQVYRNQALSLGQVQALYASGVAAQTTAIGQFGIIGTAAGTSTVFGDDNVTFGISHGATTVNGVINASSMVGTASGAALVEGVFNADDSIGVCTTHTTAIATPGSSGYAAGITNVDTAYATTYDDSLASLPNFESRIKSLLPPSWFADSNESVLNIPVAGMSYGLLWIYILYLYVIQQARIQTASGVWLDRIAYDFFGPNLPRLSGEPDSVYSARIRAAIVAKKQTRDAILESIENLTGQGTTPVNDVIPFIVQEAQATSFTGSLSSYSVTLPSTPQSGNVVVISVLLANQSSFGTLTVSDGTYTYTATPSGVQNCTNINAHTQIGIFYLFVPDNAGRTITVTSTVPGTAWELYAAELFGIGAIETDAFAQGVGNTVNTPAFETINDNDFIFSFTQIGSGFSEVNAPWKQTSVQQSFTNASGDIVSSFVRGSPSSLTTNFVQTSSGKWSSYVAVFTPVVSKSIQNQIIELWNPGDVGTYGLSASDGIGTQGYGAAGMYGSLSFPNQFLVKAYRPSGEGVPNIPGYGNPEWGYASFSGGFNNEGGGQYCDLNQIVGRVLDSDIYANIASVVGAGNTAWTVILTHPDIIGAPMAYFGSVSNSAVAIIAQSFF